MSSSLEELRNIRLAKLDLIKKSGMDPYPAKVPRSFCLADARANFADYAVATEGIVPGKNAGKEVSLTGRIMAIRGQGAILFVVLDDGRSNFQAVIKRDVLNSVDASTLEMAQKNFDFFSAVTDIGDIISVTGSLFVTQRGEQSILVSGWTMASKSLLPLPEKWHGIQDPDEKLRKRYLDFIMDSEVRQIFYKKAKFWDVTRTFMNDNGFLEVETPSLEITTGGAEATPFKTHHNDFDLDVYMRISVGELWQKRLMAGGFPKTFEIGRVYRNEGSSPEHVQEFTNLEFYWSYADYEDGMRLVVDLYRKIAIEVFGTTKFTSRGHSFDLAQDWTRISYVDEIKEQTGIDINVASDDELKSKLISLKVSYEGTNRERLIDTLWKYCRKKIAGPAFLVNHPTIVAPLAKSVIGQDGILAPVVQMFQPIIAGTEIGRGYSELNDPIDQQLRFDTQKKLLEGGDTEAMMSDDEFVEMLEHGMPPTCGFGFGERFFAILADKPLRETQLFPLMKPKKD